MKTLTEFSGVVLRNARKARDEKAGAELEPDALASAVGDEVGVGGDRATRLLEALEAIGDKLDNVRLVRVYQGEQAPPRAKSVGEFHYVIDLMASAKAAAKPQGRDQRGRGRGKPGDRGRGKPGDRGRGGGGGGGRPSKPTGLRGGGPPGGGARGSGFGMGRPERPKKGEKLPSAGAGWSLTRAPREEGERRGRGRPDRKRKRGGPKDGRGPRRDGRGRGPRRPDGAPGAKPAAGDGKPGGDGKGGAGRKPRGRGRGPRKPQGQPGKEPVVEILRRPSAAVDGEGAPKRKRKRKRKRGGRGGAGRQGGAPNTQQQTQGQQQPGAEGAPAPDSAEAKAPPRRRRVINATASNESGAEVDGNQATPTPEVNGNVALPEPSLGDDNIGNR